MSVAAGDMSSMSSKGASALVDRIWSWLSADASLSGKFSRSEVGEMVARDDYHADIAALKRKHLRASDLCAAIYRNSLESVEGMLVEDNALAVTACSHTGQLPLHVAVACGRLPIIKVLKAAAVAAEEECARRRSQKKEAMVLEAERKAALQQEWADAAASAAADDDDDTREAVLVLAEGVAAESRGAAAETRRALRAVEAPSEETVNEFRTPAGARQARQTGGGGSGSEREEQRQVGVGAACDDLLITGSAARCGESLPVGHEGIERHDAGSVCQEEDGGGRRRR